MKGISSYLVAAVFCALILSSVQKTAMPDTNGVITRVTESVHEPSDGYDIVTDLAKALKDSSLSLPHALMVRNFSNHQQPSFKCKNGNDNDRGGHQNEKNQKNLHGGYLMRMHIIAAKSKEPVDYYVFALRQILI